MVFLTNLPVFITSHFSFVLEFCYRLIRMISVKDDSYWTIIKAIFIEEKIEQWTKLKTAIKKG